MTNLNDLKFNPDHVYTIAGFDGHWMPRKWTTTTILFGRPIADGCCAPAADVTLTWQSWRNLCADGAIQDLSTR